jgi:hypothetical protein
VVQIDNSRKLVLYEAQSQGRVAPRLQLDDRQQESNGEANSDDTKHYQEELGEDQAR